MKASELALFEKGIGGRTVEQGNGAIVFANIWNAAVLSRYVIILTRGLIRDIFV